MRNTLISQQHRSFLAVLRRLNDENKSFEIARSDCSGCSEIIERAMKKVAGVNKARLTLI